MVLRRMMNTHRIKAQNNITKVRTGVKAAVVIFPILGLTWVFGLMTFNKETLFFRYLFAVFNSAQGLLIFLFNCVFNKKVSSASTIEANFLQKDYYCERERSMLTTVIPLLSRVVGLKISIIARSSICFQPSTT